MNEIKRGMKKKTIESLIRFKIEDWIKHIVIDKKENEEDDVFKQRQEKFHQDIKDNIIVTGGCIASMLLGEDVNDYDVYFKDKRVAKDVAIFYVNKLAKKSGIEDLSVSSEANSKVSRIFVEETDIGVSINIKSMGILSKSTDVKEYQYFEMAPFEDVQKFFKEYAFKETDKEKYNPSFVSSNAISLHNDIQIITRFVGNPQDIHKNFDFVHCTNYFTYESGLVLNQPALESLMSRELKYVGSMFPVCSMFRIRKFIKRQWVITAGEIFKICYDISKLDFEDFKVMKEQLTGVDAAYFLEVIDKLNQDKQNGVDIDRTYIFKIVSEMFDVD